MDRSRKWLAIVLLAFLMIFVPGSSIQAQDGRIIWVTSNADSGAGTLREVISTAQPGDVIRFSPELFPASPRGKILLETELPPLTAGNVTIDASPNGVILDGAKLAGEASGLRITSNRNIIRGLWVIKFPQNGIEISDGAQENLIGGADAGEGNTVGWNGKNGIMIRDPGTDRNILKGNNVGLDPDGQYTMPNGQHGICAENGPDGSIIGGRYGSEGNVVAGNLSAGILLNGASGSIIQGNIIGINRELEKSMPNATVGVVIMGGSNNNLLGAEDPQFGNLVCCSTGVDVWGGSSGNVIAGNQIGLQGFETLQGIGVNFSDGASNNTLGPANVIAYYGDGVGLDVANTSGNKITQNSIFDNNNSAIILIHHDKSSTAPHVSLTDAGDRSVSGSAPPNASVEIYSDAAQQSRFFEGSTRADAEGNFTFTVPVGEFKGQFITALVTDSQGNSSSLSDAKPKPQTGAIQTLPNIPTPAQVSTDPAVVGTNLFLAFFSVFYFGFTTSVFNTLFKKVQFKSNGLWAGLLPLKFQEQAHRFSQAEAGGRWRSILGFIGVWMLIALTNSFVQSFLDPSLGLFDSGRGRVVFSLLLAGLIISLMKLGMDALVHRRLGDQPNLRAELRWYGLLIALASVIFSRSLGFKPGYLLGMMGTVLLLPRIEGTERAGKRVLAVLGFVFSTTFLLWLALPILPGALAWLQSLILSIFASAISGVLFELLPLSIFDGSVLWKWKRLYWFMLFLPVSFLFIHLFLNPDARAVKALQQNGVATLLLMMLVYGLATAAMWLAFRGKRVVNINLDFLKPSGRKKYFYIYGSLLLGLIVLAAYALGGSPAPKIEPQAAAIQPGSTNLPVETSTTPPTTEGLARPASEAATATSRPPAATVTALPTPTALPLIPCDIVFESDRDHNREIYTMKADGSLQTNLTNDPGNDFDPVWSPDGAMIAFASNRKGDQAPGQFIYTMNKDGSGLAKLSQAGDSSDPDWSPNGDQIVFASKGDIFIIDLSAGSEVNLTGSAEKDARPVISPDGKRIAWLAGDRGQKIYTMELDGANKKLLIESTRELDVRWSVDGRIFTHWDNPEGICFNCLVSVDGSQVSDAGGKGTIQNYLPFWTIRNEQVELVSGDFFGAGNEDIFLVGDIFPEMFSRLTDSPGNDRNPDSPARCGPAHGE